jgi:magnesium-transporting ATPase (P-type)
VARTLNADGLRVVAVAVKETAPTQSTYSAADKSGLTLVGYIAFLDPPMDSAAPALKALAGHGIRVKVLTGDNDLVAASVCRQVGLDFDGVLLGSRLERMDDHAIAEAVERTHVLAKRTPLQKERVVRALRARGHVAGFIGDGINDAPALRAADIGISVDSAVDIAKEAADIILLEKSLLGHFMLFFGPISSVFEIVTFCVLWWVFEADSLAQQTLFQSGWFVVGLMTQTLIVQMVRTPKLPFIESMAAPPLLAMSAAIMVEGIWLPMGPLVGYFKLQALPLSCFPWLAGILISYAVSTTLMKRFYIRRFGLQ